MVVPLISPVPQNRFVDTVVGEMGPTLDLSYCAHQGIFHRCEEAPAIETRCEVRNASPTATAGAFSTPHRDGSGRAVRPAQDAAAITAMTASP